VHTFRQQQQQQQPGDSTGCHPTWMNVQPQAPPCSPAHALAEPAQVSHHHGTQEEAELVYRQSRGEMRRGEAP